MDCHFHKHQGCRRGGIDHLIEILQSCSDHQEQQKGQRHTLGTCIGDTDRGVIKQEGAIAVSKSLSVSLFVLFLLCL